MVRHGESEHNVAGIVSTPHTELTDHGQKQAENLREVFHARFPDPDKYKIITSAIDRAVHTAELMTGGKSFPVNTGLNEIESGVVAGRVSVERLNGFKERLGKERFDKRFSRLSGVQTHADHEVQVRSAVAEELNDCKEGKSLVLVAHHGTIARTADALGIKEFDAKNATLYHFVPDPESQKWIISEVGIKNGKTEETQLVVSLPETSTGMGR